MVLKKRASASKGQKRSYKAISPRPVLSEARSQSAPGSWHRRPRGGGSTAPATASSGMPDALHSAKPFYAATQTRSPLSVHSSCRVQIIGDASGHRAEVQVTTFLQASAAGPVLIGLSSFIMARGKTSFLRPFCIVANKNEAFTGLIFIKLLNPLLNFQYSTK